MSMTGNLSGNKGLRGVLSSGNGGLKGQLASVGSLYGTLSSDGELKAVLDRSFWTLRVEHVYALPTTDIDPHVVYVVGG